MSSATVCSYLRNTPDPKNLWAISSSQARNRKCT